MHFSVYFQLAKVMKSVFFWATTFRTTTRGSLSKTWVNKYVALLVRDPSHRSQHPWTMEPASLLVIPRNYPNTSRVVWHAFFFPNFDSSHLQKSTRISSVNDLTRQTCVFSLAELHRVLVKFALFFGAKSQFLVENIYAKMKLATLLLFSMWRHVVTSHMSITAIHSPSFFKLIGSLQNWEWPPNTIHRFHVELISLQVQLP